MRRSRSILKLFALLTVLMAAAGPELAAASDGASAQRAAIEIAQTDLLQCMETCIRAEGSDSKATCKSRCANVPSAFGNGGPKKRDCMADFKSCKRQCPKTDKDCNRVCKERLMGCPG